MGIGKWGAMSAPDILPFGYGEHTSGGFGRLIIQDSPDLPTTRSPYRGPGNVSPMNQGDFNLPAWAPPIQESAGGVIPFSTISAGVNNQSPQQPGTPYAKHYYMAGPGYNGAGQYGIFDFSTSARAARQEKRQSRRSTRKKTRAYPKSRDVLPPNTTGGYRYRQFSDGSIFVMPGSPALVGQTLTATGDVRRWNAITNEIGPFPARAGAGTGIANVLTSLTAFTQAVTPLVGAGAAGAADEGPPLPGGGGGAPPPMTKAAGIPTWMWAVGGVALLGGIVLFAKQR